MFICGEILCGKVSDSLFSHEILEIVTLVPFTVFLGHAIQEAISGVSGICH